MKSNKSNHKLFAKEILILFAGIFIVGLCWGVLLIRNIYYDNKTQNISKQLSSLKDKINQLPIDKLNVLYNTLKNNFIVTYKENNDSFKIPKTQEISFLNDHPFAKNVPPHEIGYSYSYYKYDRTSNNYIFFNDKEAKQLNDAKVKWELKWERLHSRGNKIDESAELKDIARMAIAESLLGFIDEEKSVFFDFVEFDKFKILISDSNYRNILFTKFHEIIDNRATFETNITYGLTHTYDSKTDTIRINYNNDILILNNSLSKSENNILNNALIFHILLLIGLIIGLILFPLRLIFILLKWAFKTLN